MKKLLFITLIALASCSKTTTNTTPKASIDKFEIISYKTKWCVCQSYVADITYSYTIDTTGVDYIEITNNLRQGQNYSFKDKSPKPTAIVSAVDLVACSGCQTIYYFSIIYRNKTVKYLPEIRL